MSNCGCTDTTPCTSQECGCKFEVDAGCVRYTGDTLSCINAQTGDLLADILLDLNTKFCNLVEGNYIEVSQEVAGANCDTGGIKIVVKNINTLAVINTEYLCNPPVAISYDEVVNFDKLTPTTVGVVFSPNTQEVEGILYVSTVDTSSWIWDGTIYKTAPTISRTEWVYKGTGTDAGSNKTLPIERSGEINVSSDSYFNAIRVGKGKNSIAGSTAVGEGALFTNISGQNNTAVGKQVLRLNTTGSNNVGLGTTTLQSNTTGGSNTGIGTFSMFSNTTGSNNTTLGAASLQLNLIGSYNTAIGYGALSSSTASGLTAVGFNALASSTIGTGLTAIGSDALSYNTEGINNTALGVSALQYNTTASNNTAIGTQTLFHNTTGISNTAVGSAAMSQNTTGGYNIAIGQSALAYNIIGNYNLAVGYEALKSNIASENLAIGYQSQFNNQNGTQNVSIGNETLRDSTGSRNVAIGYKASQLNTTGDNNTSFGYQTLINNTEGAFNTGLGGGALANSNTGNFNTAVGYIALSNNLTGTNNISIGYGAGNVIANGLTSNTASQDSIFIGSATRALTSSDTNQIVIGNGARGKGSNTVQIGGTGTIGTHIQGDLYLNPAATITTAAVTQTKYLPITINGVVYKLLLAD